MSQDVGASLSGAVAEAVVTQDIVASSTGAGGRMHCHKKGRS